MLGVIKLVPVPSKVPPEGTLYQFNVPILVVALNVKLPVSHLLAGVVEVIVATANTVAFTAVRAELQPPFTTST